MNGASIPVIAQIIQLSVAPVFFLAGIGGFLNVLAARLARVVDRARSLERHVPTADADEKAMELAELAVLDRRMALCHWSIGLCTAAAVLICLVIAVLFVADLVTMNFALPVSLLFIGAVTTLTAGLMLFLAEVTIATRHVRVSEQFVMRRWRHDRRR
jgi:Protein of unknown function (DUF2721)